MNLKNVITDHYLIVHNDSKVVYAKCRQTGRFVKHALVIEHCLFNEVVSELTSNSTISTALVLSFCFLANIVAIFFLISEF